MAKYGGAATFPKTAENVDAWLDAIALPQYKETFAGLQLTDLPRLENSRLRELVPPEGPRKRIVLAIKALEVGLSPASAVEPQQKFNSTSSMYIDSTIVKPCTDEIIFCVSIVLHDRIEEGEAASSEQAAAAHNLAMFDITKKPLFPDLPSDHSEGSIYQVIKAIYKIAEFSPECLVISLLYIERLRVNAGIPLLLSNWQPLLLASMVIAQKVWDDRALLNVDFTLICSTYTVKDINLVEKKLLELIQYNVSVTASLYASYYFELRTLCEKSQRPFTLKPLSEDARRSLESRSLGIKGELEKDRRWQSAAVGGRVQVQ